MPLTLKCPSCNYAVASYDEDKREYRIWSPKARHLGGHALTGPARVQCKKCDLIQTIPAQLPTPYVCPNHQTELAHQFPDDRTHTKIVIHLPSIRNEIFCANALIICQSGACKQYVDLDVLRTTGKGISFEADYSHLQKSEKQV